MKVFVQERRKARQLQATHVCFYVNFLGKQGSCPCSEHSGRKRENN